MCNPKKEIKNKQSRKANRKIQRNKNNRDIYNKLKMRLEKSESLNEKYIHENTKLKGYLIDASNDVKKLEKEIKDLKENGKKENKKK